MHDPCCSACCSASRHTHQARPAVVAGTATAAPPLLLLLLLLLLLNRSSEASASCSARARGRPAGGGKERGPCPRTTAVGGTRQQRKGACGASALQHAHLQRVSAVAHAVNQRRAQARLKPELARAPGAQPAARATGSWSVMAVGAGGLSTATRLPFPSMCAGRRGTGWVASAGVAALQAGGGAGGAALLWASTGTQAGWGVLPGAGAQAKQRWRGCPAGRRVVWGRSEQRPANGLCCLAQGHRLSGQSRSHTHMHPSRCRGVRGRPARGGSLSTGLALDSHRGSCSCVSCQLGFTQLIRLQGVERKAYRSTYLAAVLGAASCSATSTPGLEQRLV